MVGLRFKFQNDQKLVLHICNGTTTRSFDKGTTNDVPINEWVHFALKYTHTTHFLLHEWTTQHTHTTHNSVSTNTHHTHTHWTEYTHTHTHTDYTHIHTRFPNCKTNNLY